MKILESIPCGPFATNAYILTCKETNRGLFIDPAPDSYDKLVKASASCKIEAILLTHSHWDHMTDAKKLKERFDVPVYVHPEDSANVRHPGSDGLPLMMSIEGFEPDRDLADKQTLHLGHLQIDVIHTPGHTPGGVCFYLAEHKILISGDTLFKGTIGNLSFPTANPSMMWKSLETLAKLPPDTRIYPGHGPTTTIGEEGWLLSQAKANFEHPSTY